MVFGLCRAGRFDLEIFFRCMALLVWEVVWREWSCGDT